MAQYNSEVAYKNTDPFFNNLNRDLGELKHVSKIARDISRLKDYFDILDNFITHYNPYLPYLGDRLSKCEDVVYSVEYNRFFNKGKGMSNLDEPKNNAFFKKMVNTRKELKDIHSKIMEGFLDNDLLPKIIKRKQYDKGRAIIGG